MPLQPFLPQTFWPQASVTGLITAFLLGSMAAFQSPDLAWPLPTGAGLLMLAGWLHLGRSKDLAAFGFAFVGVPCLAYGLAGSALNEHLATLPQAHHLNKSYQLEAELLDQYNTRYGWALVVGLIQITSPEDPGFALNKLTLYVPEETGLLQRGARILVWVRLKRSLGPRPFPHPMASLREKFWPRYYGQVKSVALIKGPAAEEISQGTSRLNQGMQELLALFTQGKASPLWRERFEPYGLGHLLAISGLHCLVVFLLLQLIMVPLRRPGLRIALGVGGLLAFAAWMNWTTSVTRAALLLSAWQLLPALNRRRSWLRLWSALLLVLVASEPLLLLSRGFWFSFAASLGLFLGRTRHRSALDHPLLTRLRPWLPIIAAQAFVLPIHLMFNGHAGLLGFFWNLFGFVALAALLLLFGLGLIAQFSNALAAIVNTLEQWITQVLAFFAADPGILEMVRFPHVPTLGLTMVAASAAILHFGGREWRWYLLLILLLGLGASHRPLQGPRFVVLDVGQGSCAFYVGEDGGSYAFDAGGALPFGTEFRHLAKLYGVEFWQMVFLSHHNLDHYEFAQNLPAGTPLLVPATQMDQFAQDPIFRGHLLVPIQAGWHLDLPDGYIKAIWPAPKVQSPNDNESGLVLEWQCDQTRVLLTGDAGTWSEPHWPIEAQPAATQVLVVGHHGSRSATSNNLLQRFKPQVAMISCGRENRFNHPHPGVVKRLQKHQVTIFSTADSGSIQVWPGQPKPTR